MGESAPDPDDRAAVAGFVRRVGAAVVATVDPDGAPEAAFVGMTARDDGALLFNAHRDARKMVNLRASDRVAVVVGGEEVSLQLEGRARITTGAERTAAEQLYLARFPGSRVADPAFEVILIVPAWVRTYDVSGASAHVREAVWLPSAG